MIPDASAEQFLAHLLAGDRRACRADVKRLLEAGLAPRELYEDLFQASLYKIGERWQRGQVSVAVEHVATAIVEDLLSMVFPHALQREPVGRTAIVTCAANEYHQVGGRIVADSLESAGWSVHFVGANCPMDGLVQLLAERRPDLLAFSVSIAQNLPQALEALHRARAVAPDVRIIVGGQAFSQPGAEAFDGLPGVERLSSLSALDDLIEKWN